jgi:hypothetical protein
MYIPRYLLVGSLCGAIAVSSAAGWSYSPNGSGRNASDADQYQSDPGQYGAQDDSGQYSGDADDYDQYDQPVEYANEAPPPLPEYQQPICPGEGYIWTPGYWYWGSEGFYWVPGAWVYAPYEGALWTPGFWSYRGGRYGWHRGFWGRQVGYYGGIDYGYGYTGYGYEGGRWDGDRFAYNRAVNNVNVTVIHNVYDRPIENNRGNRVSYNGPGGMRVRPRPAEIQAIRQPHNPPMAAQLQHAQQAQQIRQNFARVNHGRPQVVVDQRPIQADRNVRPPAAAPMRQGGSNVRNGEQPRPGQPTPRGDVRQPNGRTPEPRVNERPGGSEPSPEPRATPRANPARPVAPMRTQPAPREQQPQTRQDRPTPMPRTERPQTMPDRQAPERHDQPAPERQSPPVQRPMPQERPAPVQRPQTVPQQRPERPAAPPRQEQQRPAREVRPAPNPHANPRATEQKSEPHRQGDRKPQ